VRILAYHEMREQANFLADRRQVKERRHGRLQLIAEAADIDGELRGRLGSDSAAQRADHLLHRRPERPAAATDAGVQLPLVRVAHGDRECVGRIGRRPLGER